MKKLTILGLFMLYALIMPPLISYGQNDPNPTTAEWVQVNTADIPPDLLIYLQNNGYVRYQNPYLKPEKLSGFMENVIYFASATDVTLSKITENTNKFSETGLGNLAMFVIAYKVMGKDALNFFGQFIALILFLTLFLIWWRKYLLPRSVLEKNTHKEVTGDVKTLTYKFRVPVLWHQAGWLAFFLIVCFIIL